ncbi:hypothetical protein [Parapedobacter sp.]
MKSNLILLIAAAMATTACSRDGNMVPENAFAIELTAVALEHQGSVKLFTKSGEVTDEAVIANFIASERGFNAPFAPEPSNAITFTTDSTAQLGTSDVLYGVSREDNDVVVFRSPFILGPYATGAARWTALDTYRLGKHNDPLETFHSVGQLLYKGEAVIYCQGNYQSLLFPMMIYKLYRQSGTEGQSSESMISGKLFNEFDEDFLETLGDKDTLAYQQSYVRFSK